MEFVLAPELKSDIKRIVLKLELTYINVDNIVPFKSFGSKSRAIARIWSLPKIWQIALNTDAHYCIEVVSERFDRLSQPDKEKVIIHELLHVPKNFSGALLPHRQRSKRIDRRTIEKLYVQLHNY
ncbi:metallopeptidase [Candidatus Shapirobacteria bacterium CG10_big_fil_rev_8_21_14_0_10_38_14]|uniref:Metallopeptidase n=1 Tax=Candidatus Shapirobacteria bacterium CG10_big_fil_rev_8_21_14_0_10_38_14 TaxID=1974483 RepID=A0A2M8L6A3_9BACT|nr:MAG: metallopeptidase [Candidatus Shapirobacteria bacterium CG10_big_fil_rev_8_21_14_0_10_38_14]